MTCRRWEIAPQSTAVYGRSPPTGGNRPGIHARVYYFFFNKSCDFAVNELEPIGKRMMMRSRVTQAEVRGNGFLDLHCRE